MKITIGHLYPELLNLYGDRGNIQAMRKRLEWRGFEAEVCEYSLDDNIDFTNLDIVFLGGGSDREQLMVCDRLKKIRPDFFEYVEVGGSVVAICGGYQLLGCYYKLGGQTIEGLSILNIVTERGKGRLIGNVVVQSDLIEMPIVGFANHGGRTQIGKYEPLGRVLYGGGNNGEDDGEGVIYKNVIGTYLHGPLFPKNPQLCDLVLTRAIHCKDPGVAIPALDDADEIAANQYILKRFKSSE